MVPIAQRLLEQYKEGVVKQAKVLSNGRGQAQQQKEDFEKARKLILAINTELFYMKNL